MEPCHSVEPSVRPLDTYGSKYDAVRIIAISELDNASVRFDNNPLGSSVGFGVENDSFEWCIRRSVPKSRDAVGLRPALGIVLQHKVVRIAPEVQHAV
jgi:hypothetical protein